MSEKTTVVFIPPGEQRAAERLADIEKTVAECTEDTREAPQDPPCELCAERIKDAAVIRDLLAALTEARHEAEAQARELNLQQDHINACAEWLTEARRARGAEQT
jgi:replicative DNA helicase